MRRFWLLSTSAAALMGFGACPTASADDAEFCLHGIYLDAVDGKAYACPWGGGMVHTTHGDVLVNPGGIVVPDSAYAFGLPDDGDDGGDSGPDNGDNGE